MRWAWMIVLLALLLVGCSAATVTETYQRTAPEAESIGEGRQEVEVYTYDPATGKFERLFCEGGG